MGEREQTICTLLPMVRALARSIAYKVPCCDLEDLVAEGALGAIRAVDTFDPARGVPLRAYARRLVFGAILNGVRRMDIVPEHVRREARAAERLRYELYARRRREPRVEEIARLTGADPRRLSETLQRTSLLTMLSLDEPLPPGYREPAGGEEPSAVLLQAARRAALRRALATLPARERYVVIQHYTERVSFRTLGVQLGITRQRTSQLHVRALRRLRRHLDGEAVA